MEPESSTPRPLKKSPYTVLLCTLVLLLVGWPALEESSLPRWLVPLVHAAFFSVMLAGVLYSVRARRGRRWFLGLIVFAFAADWTDGVTEGDLTTILAHAIGAVFLGYVTVLVIGRVFSPGRVTADRILAALCGYLFLGMLWSALFALIWYTTGGVHSDAFSFPIGELVTHTDFTYFSFVTLTTLGYGEITPVDPLARSLAYLEATVGQLYIAVIVARLVALELIDAQRFGRGSRGE